MTYKSMTRIGVALLALASMAALCGGPAQTAISPTATQAVAILPTAVATATAAPASSATTTAATVAATSTAAPIAAATSTTAATPAAPPQPDMLRVAIPFLVTLDPIRSYNVELAILGNVCERLLDHNPLGSSSAYTYKLATSLTHSDDGLTWTATLRAGVKFHDGTPLTAAAVKGTIAAVRDHSEFAQNYAALSGVDTPDDHTVVFHLSSPLDLALTLAEAYGNQIISLKALAADKADATAFSKGLDGCTGPYRIKSATPNTVELALNPDYWNPVAVPGRPSTVRVLIVPAANEASMLRKGQLDLAFGLSTADTASFKGDPAFTLYSGLSHGGSLLFIYTQHSPVDDKRVRQAVAAAIDTQAIIAQGNQASGLPVYPSHGPVPDGMYPASPDVPVNHYDLAAAKQLLTDAGHPGGGFSLRLAYFGTDPGPIVPLIVKDLAQIGVTVDAQGLAAPVLIKQITSSNPADHPDLFLGGNFPFALDGGPDILVTFFHSGKTGGRNFSGYNNPAYDQLVDSALAQEVTNPAAALALYIRAEKVIVDDAPAVFLSTDGNNFALPNYLKGFAFNADYWNFVDFSALYYPK